MILLCLHMQKKKKKKKKNDFGAVGMYFGCYMLPPKVIPYNKLYVVDELWHIKICAAKSHIKWAYVDDKW